MVKGYGEMGARVDFPKRERKMKMDNEEQEGVSKKGTFPKLSSRCSFCVQLLFVQKSMVESGRLLFRASSSSSIVFVVGQIFSARRI